MGGRREGETSVQSEEKEGSDQTIEEVETSMVEETRLSRTVSSTKRRGSNKINRWSDPVGPVLSFEKELRRGP